MPPAFVPSSFKPVSLHTSFAGTAVAPAPAARPASVKMEAYSLDKYSKYNDDARPQPPPAPSSSSAWWVAYRDSLKEKFSPFRAPKDAETTVGYSQAAVMAASTPYFLIQSKINAAAFGKGGDPDAILSAPARVADRYMADCIARQYKATAAPTGVYNVQCTEGTVRGQAEYARSLSLSAEFRMKQRSPAQKFGDFCETRRNAIIAAHGCSYEEKLVDAYPRAARTFVRAGSEARNVCVRYAAGASPEEAYMVNCVDKQLKFRAVPNGVYDVMCCDGNAKDVAEYKRVQALSARFRVNQLPATVKEQVKFDSAKYARDFFAHGCSYEEALFNKYPAVSASMRPSTVRY